MYIYSKKIIRFIDEVKSAIHAILLKETRVKVTRDRLYDFRGAYSYPIEVRIYNNKSKLGYFDPNFYELGFNECLMHANTRQLHNVIRHELAHYLYFINYGMADQIHGFQFRAFCLSLGWGPEVYGATMNIENLMGSSNIESNVFRKIQKLMALSTSSNQHEAEQAMIKSQQLLLKHNLDAKDENASSDEQIYISKRILKQKRENAKMRSIAKILDTFFVYSVYCRDHNHIYLEILGNPVSVEIADYVAAILQDQFEKMWKQVQKAHVGLKGVTAKNSFFLGIARGYCDKINALQRSYDIGVKNSLMLIETKFESLKSQIFPHLRAGKSSGGYCRFSSALGEECGKGLNINPALNQTNKNSDTYIGYS